MIDDPSAGSTLTFKFTTKVMGVLSTLGGAPVVSVYKAGSTSEVTTGITLTPDYDSRTGVNNVAIDTASDGTFYANGSDYDVVITTGTLQGASIAGDVVGHFRLMAPGGGSSPTPGTAAQIYRYVAGGKNQALIIKGDADKPVFAVDFSAGCQGGMAIAGTVVGTDSSGNTSTNIVSSGIVTFGRTVYVRLNTGGSGGTGDAVDGSRFRVRVTATGDDDSILQFDVYVLVRAITYGPL